MSSFSAKKVKKSFLGPKNMRNWGLFDGGYLLFLWQAGGDTQALIINY